MFYNANGSPAAESDIKSRSRGAMKIAERLTSRMRVHLRLARIVLISGDEQRAKKLNSMAERLGKRAEVFRRIAHGLDSNLVPKSFEYGPQRSPEWKAGSRPWRPNENEG